MTDSEKKIGGINIEQHRMKLRDTFECPICRRSFKTPEGKYGHMERHGINRDQNLDLDDYE